MPTGIYIRKPMKQETKDKISKSNKGKCKSKTHRKNMSNSMKGKIPWNKGKKGLQHAWNKGLTKETDNRLNYNRPTSFKKGFTPWNKNTKGLTCANKTSFKHGNIPPFKGKIISLEMRKRISMTLTGVSEFNGFKKSEASRIRRSEKYKKWRIFIFERDCYTCTITKQIGGKLVVHHIESFANNKDKRFNINNGITITEKIHRLFHKIYGYNNNNIKQFTKFREDYKNGKYKKDKY